jgi:hypothetical protein
MRFGVLALAGALALPAAAAAQNTGGFPAQPPADLVPYTRFAVTPWVGVRAPYGSGDYFVVTEGGDQYQLEEDRGGGVAVGLNAEYRITGPLNLVAGVTYSAGDQNELTVTSLGSTATETTFLGDGPEMWFVKAGVQYRLPDPIPDNRRFHPAAYITVAPSLVVADYPEFDGVDDENLTGSSSHFGLNLAVDAVNAIGSRGLALSFGVEDYITFWNQDDVRGHDEAVLGGLFEEPVTIDYNSSIANILVLRAGLSWRF